MEESHLPLRDRSGPTGGVHVPCHVDDKFRYMQTRSGLLQVSIYSPTRLFLPPKIIPDVLISLSSAVKWCFLFAKSSRSII